MIKKNSFFAAAALFCFEITANAAEVPMNTAIMQAMDKITGHVDLIEVPVNQEVLFGTFSILVRDCKASAPEETPENFAFVDIVDNVANDTKVNIFKGWMVSSSPALNPVAHPVYDVWLLKCSNISANKIKPMSEKELALRDEIEMIRTPQKENINLSKDVYDDIEEELQKNEPENLIPETLIEEQIETAESSAEDESVAIETAVDNSFENEDTSQPEALVIIKEKTPQKTDTTVPSQDNSSDWKDVSDEDNQTNILELEKELSEKAIGD